MSIVLGWKTSRVAASLKMVVISRYLLHLDRHITQITSDITLTKLFDFVMVSFFLGDMGHVIGVCDAEEAQI